MEKEEHKKNIDRKTSVKNFIYHEITIIILSLIFFGLVVGSIIYFEISSSRVYTDKASIQAPIISLKPVNPGVLDRVFVKEGDYVNINTVVASVGGQNMNTKTDGVITFVKNVPGQFVTSQDMIVQMIDPSELRVVGQVEEDKGLSDVRVGQKVIFTVDAFPSRQYSGIVDIISPTSSESSIIFSISDKREQKSFDVIVSFDYKNYPELKNGMSAKMWIYK